MSRRRQSVRVVALAVIAVAATAACARGDRAGASPRNDATADVRLSDDVSMHRAAPGVWVHTTWATLSGGTRYPSNGLLVEQGDSSLLIDTAWDSAQTHAILRWADSALRRPVRRAIVTHSHSDRVGGMGALAAHHVRTSALPLTVRRAGAGGVAPLPDSVATLARGEIVPIDGVEVLFPGAGHAPDNLVVYLPGPGVLFGGCLIKPDTATTSGNVADADLPGWPTAARRVALAFPNATIVVPGHGAIGGRRALEHTATLIELLHTPGS